MFLKHPGAAALIELLAPAKAKAQSVLDSTEADKQKDEDKEEQVFDAAGDYASTDIALKAAAAVQQWAETDDLDEGEGLGDRLFSLLAGIADADLDGELSDDEIEVMTLACESAWDYLEGKDVPEDDISALLNDFDNDVAARVQELIIDRLPDGDEASALDLDAFAFGDGSDEAALDSASQHGIKDNTFAYACYKQNSIKELEASLKQKADKTDMKEWDLTEKEYFDQIKLALKAKKADGLDSVFDAVYKKKLVIRKGKRVRINKRVSGTVRLSAKQKMAVKKMLRKSHSAVATMRRAKSQRLSRKFAK